MKHKFLLLYSWLIRTIMFFFPDIPMIMRFRGWCYSFGMKKAGNDFQVSSSVIIKGLENFSVGSNCYLAPNVIINCSGRISFDDQVMIGFNSVLVSSNHSLTALSYRYGQRIIAPIFIGFGSWVGASATILSGVTIGSSTVIAANSVVNINCDSESVYGGVPCKLLKRNK